MGRKVGICLASHIHAVKFGIIPTSQMGKLRCRCWRESALAVPLSQFCFRPSDGQAPCSMPWNDGGALRVVRSKVSQGRLLSVKLNLGLLFLILRRMLLSLSAIVCPSLPLPLSFHQFSVPATIYAKSAIATVKFSYAWLFFFLNLGYFLRCVDMNLEMTILKINI